MKKECKKTESTHDRISIIINIATKVKFELVQSIPQRKIRIEQKRIIFPTMKNELAKPCVVNTMNDKLRGNNC